MNIPLEILQIIANHCDVQTKLNVKMVCKYNNDNIWINNVYDKLYYQIWNKVIEYPNISSKINQIMINHKYITMLNIKSNDNIFDDDIKHLKYVHTLYANNTISDLGIKHMKLHTLYASGNTKITDLGIKHMNLHTLYASYNLKITDLGIKHMYLHTLYASGNT